MNANDRPWMTALEMQFNVIRIMDALGTNYGQIDAHTSFKDMARRAETFAWSGEAAIAALLASRTIPKSSKLSRAVLPAGGVGWWWFDTPLKLLHGEVEISALLFGPSTDGEIWFQCFTTMDMAIVGATEQAKSHFAPLDKVHTQAAFLSSRGFKLMPLVSWSFDIDRADINHFESGVRRPTQPHLDAAGGLMVELLRFFLAGCSWLQQRVVTFSSGPVERHRRKQIAREYNTPLPSDVKVIQLRRSESETRQTTSAHESIDWTCRWIVGGHWRNQPYKDERKLIYIMPFVKGPKDKPLRVPSHTVYSVSR